jgi:hypothetical protein
MLKFDIYNTINMDPKYLKISKGNKHIYFRINNIKKYNCYSVHGVELYDYHIIINDMYIYDNKLLEKECEGLFLYIDEKKNIRIYDNIKREYYDIEDNDDVNHISYFYYGNTYCTSLQNAVKEILLRVIVDS